MKSAVAFALVSLGLASISPAAAADAPSCPQLKVCSEAIETSEQLNLDTCLAGKPVEVGLSIRGSLDIIKRAISGDIKASYDNAVRASSKFSDELQRPENTEIRQCLEGLRTIVNRCMQRATEQCLAESPYPPGIDLRFRVKFKEPALDLFDGTSIAVSYLEPEHGENPAELELNSKGWYPDRIDMATRDGRFNGLITRVVKTSSDDRLAGHRFKTPICLRWASRPPPKSAPKIAYYACSESSPRGTCAPHDDDLGWLQQCPEDHSSSWPSFALIGAAQAQPATARTWIVPSLATLRRWRDSELVGYTEFEITATTSTAIAADRAAVRVLVNGAELFVDGAQAEYQARPFVPGGTLRLAFGVQSLDLDGRLGGCNRIEADVLYLKGGKVVEEHSLAQTFAAMRQLAPVERTVGDTAYRWSGSYVRPAHGAEHMVFVRSIEKKSFQPEQLAEARREIEKEKAKFDAKAVEVDGKRLVGIVRPPLEKPAYGLGIAIVEPTGQLRFVFPAGEAIALAKRLKEMREHAGLKAIMDEPFAYAEKKDTIRPGICPAA